MVLEWAFGYAAGKALDLLLPPASFRSLNAQLDAEMTTWMTTLPSGMKLSSSEVLLANRVLDGALDERANLLGLREALQRKILPEVEVWELALREQWSFIRSRADNYEDIQEFFSNDEGVILPYLVDLAQRLHDICARRLEFFGPASIKKTNEIREEMKQLSSQVGTYQQGEVDRGQEILEGIRGISQHLEDFQKGRWEPNSSTVCMPQTSPSLMQASHSLAKPEGPNLIGRYDYLDEEIDGLAEYVAKSPKVALNLLSKLRERLDDTVSGHHRYRIAGNIALCQYHLGDEDSAALGMISAYDLDTSNPKASANKALGLLIRKDITALKRFAVGKLQDQRDNAVLAAYLIKGLIHDTLTLDPLTLIPKNLHNSPEVTLAHCEWLMTRGTLEEWKSFSVTSYEKNADDDAIGEIYALALLSETLEFFQHEGASRSQTTKCPPIEACTRILVELWNKQLASEIVEPRGGVSIPANLIVAYQLSNDFAKAIEVGNKALEIFPHDADIGIRLARSKFELGAIKETLVYLNAQDITPEMVVLYLQALVANGDWRDVVALVENHLEKFPDSEKEIALAGRLVAEVQLEEASEREGLLSSAYDSFKGQIRALMLLLQVAEHNNLSGLASRIFDDAADLIDEKEVRYIERTAVANAAMNRGNCKFVVDTLYDFVPLGRDSEELQMLSRALAFDTPIRERAVKFFERLLPTVRQLPFYQWAEGCCLFNRGSFSDAVNCFQRSYEGDQKLTSLVGLVRSLLANDQKSDVVGLIARENLDDLEGSPQDSMFLCLVLAEFGDAEGAISSAYEIVSKNSNNSKIVNSFCAIALKVGTSHSASGSTVVAPGAWVRLTSEEDFIFEGLVDEHENRSWGAAVRSKGTLFGSATGLQPGDKFAAPDFYGNGLTWNVEEVCPNWVRAYRHLSETFAQNFPNEEGVRVFRMVNDDIEPILKMVREQSEAADTKVDLYLRSSLPLAVVAGPRMGGPLYLANNILERGESIRTSSGSPEERTTALRLIEGNQKNGAVVDMYTAQVAAALNVLDVLEDQLGPLTIPACDLAELKGVLDAMNGFSKEESLSLSYSNGSYYKEVRDGSERNESYHIASRLLSRITDFCSSEPFVLPDTLPDAVGALVKANAANTISSAILAGNTRLLLTDDAYLRLFGNAILSVNGVWIQVVLYAALCEQKITPERYAYALVGLVQHKHHSVFVDAYVFLTIYEEGDDLNLVNFQTLCTCLGVQNADLESHIKVAANVINSLWAGNFSKDRKVFLATSFVLRALLFRHRGEEWVQWAAMLFVVLDPNVRHYFQKWCFGHFLQFSKVEEFVSKWGRGPNKTTS